MAHLRERLPYFVVITGASRGIGRRIALSFALNLPAGSVMNLIARNYQDLVNIKVSIDLCAIKGLEVKTFTLDLTSPDVSAYERIFNATGRFDRAIIFHNAGQVGELKSTLDCVDLNYWREYYDLNVFSVGILNSIFVKKMRELGAVSIEVVNMSSLCGIKPFVNMAMYGSAKAARNLYFQVLAAEEPDIKVLNYCPGPVQTKMVTEIMENASSETTRNDFIKLKEMGALLTPEQTVNKLLGILRDNNYKSGDVIDYYDTINYDIRMFQDKRES